MFINFRLWKINKSRKAGGTGQEGVSELNEYDLYWIPSVPNFVNIDSAIVRQSGNAWLFQFTTAKNHSYIKRRLSTRFFNNIAIDGLVLGQKTIIFVVPKGTSFTPPDVGNECLVRVDTVDCTSMDTVVADLKRIMAATID